MSVSPYGSPPGEPSQGQPPYQAPPEHQVQPPYPAQPGYQVQPPYPAPPGYQGQSPYPAPPGYQVQPPVYGAPVPYPQAYPVAQPTNGMAVASLVCSLVGLIGGWLLIVPGIGAVLGVIFGHIALNQIKTDGKEGRGVAMTGLIIGYGAIGLFVLSIIGGVILGFALGAFNS